DTGHAVLVFGANANGDVAFVDAQKGDVRHTWADTSRARAELGFRPRTSLREGLRAEREWLMRRG
ncbi:MAG: hypothetical protein AABZ64_12365, partial [Nitrospinota bacterium]